MISDPRDNWHAGKMRDPSTVWRSIHVLHRILPSEVRERKGKDDRCNDRERKIHHTEKRCRKRPIERTQQQVATCNRQVDSGPDFLRSIPFQFQHTETPIGFQPRRFANSARTNFLDIRRPRKADQDTTRTANTHFP